MQCTLNFSDKERTGLLRFLKQFPEKKTNNAFELFRCKICESTATLYTSGKLLLQGSDCEKAKEKILKAVDQDDEPILGIDETGRGEETGPFVIAAVLAKPSRMRQLRDSKKVKDLEKKRRLVEKNALGISVFVIGSKELGLLHKQGVNLNQIETAAINSWRDFFTETGKKPRIVVDGNPLKGCKAGISFLVKGDDINPVIGAASVIAKSVREKSGDKGKRLGWGSWGKKKGA